MQFEIFKSYFDLTQLEPFDSEKKPWIEIPFIHFWNFFPTTQLIEPQRWFDFVHIFFYLHVIRTPCLLETSEYVREVSLLR